MAFGSWVKKLFTNFPIPEETGREMLSNFPTSRKPGKSLSRAALQEIQIFESEKF